VESGKLLKKLDNGGKRVNCLLFGIETSHILVAEIDIVAIGLKSGKVVKKFVGHTDSVNTLLFSEGGGKLISGSYDGSMRFWNYSTAECLINYKPSIEKLRSSSSVLNVIDLKQGKDGKQTLAICNKSNNVLVVNMNCSVEKILSSEEHEDFVGACVSAQRNILYAMTLSSYLYVFCLKTGKLLDFFKVEGISEVLMLDHNPARNQIILNTLNGELVLLQA